MTSPNVCPSGHFCPSYTYFSENGLFYEKLKCPLGTYNPSTGMKNVTGCLACPTGKYCASEALTAVTGSCSQGYFCSQYAESPTPQVLHKYNYYGPCPVGYYCPQGVATPTPCTIGTYSSKNLYIIVL